MTTTKLYYKNSKLKNFEATVISCEPKKDKFLVVLDQTAFYPEGGGQPCDTGFINNIPVSHVSDKENTVYHLLDSALEKGTTIQGEIDYDKRQIYTQLHSGEHIVSGVIYNEYGYNNVGFHMDEKIAVIDIDGELNQEDLNKIELLANKEIFANSQFTIAYPSKEELETIEYRCKKQLTGEVRIVYAGSSDICACCGTHVQCCGEIGLIKILSAQKHRGGLRISLTAGIAALNHYNICHNSITEISKNLSSKPEEITQAVSKLQNDLIQEKIISSKAKHQLMENWASAFENTSRYLITVQEDLSANELREYALLLSPKTKSFVLALSNNTDGYKYALTSANIDISSINKILKEQLGAKGGGKSDLCQGNISATLNNIIQVIKEGLV